MSAFLDETGTLITVDHSNPLPVALVAGFTSLNDGELKTASYANPLPVTVVTTDYTEAELPDADDVAVGTEVYNTTYKVKLRSDGTRWIPLAPFIAYADLLADSVTGTTATTTLREVELPFKYIGPNGQIRWFFAGENTNNANAKSMIVSLYDGTTLWGTYNSNTTTNGRTISKTISAAGEEYNFWVSNNTAALADSSGNNASYQLLAPTTSLKLLVRAALGDAADTVTLTRLSIQIIPGF